MSIHEDAIQVIESRLKLLEGGDKSGLVYAEASMAIQMASVCRAIGPIDYIEFSERLIKHL